MKPIKVGLFGYGRTGKMVVNEFLKDPGFQVQWVIRKREQDIGKYASRLMGLEVDEGPIYSIQGVSREFYQENPVDMIVDFSDTSGVRFYQEAAAQDIRIISAVSHYLPEDLTLLYSLGEKTTVLYSPNITLGINVLLVASQLLQKIAPHADIAIVEEHFKNKPEVSGTARRVADVLGLDHEQIRSIRAGGIVGRHEIIFGMPNQTIRMVHESISRAAFGQGAIFAANYLIGQPQGIYTMDQIITDMFRNNLPIY